MVMFMIAMNGYWLDGGKGIIWGWDRDRERLECDTRLFVFLLMGGFEVLGEGRGRGV